MLLCIGDPKANCYDVEEWWIRERDVACRVVFGNMKGEFPHAGPEVVTVEQRLVTTTLSIGRLAHDDMPGITVNLCKFDSHAGSWPTVSHIKYVCRQAPHKHTHPAQATSMTISPLFPTSKSSMIVLNLQLPNPASFRLKQIKNRLQLSFAFIDVIEIQSNKLMRKYDPPVSFMEVVVRHKLGLILLGLVPWTCDFDGFRHVEARLFRKLLKQRLDASPGIKYIIYNKQRVARITVLDDVVQAMDSYCF